jgi:DNA-binding response OmpR family regulator
VGYAVDVASDGETGLMMGLDGVHDLIILDINLSSKDGLNILHDGKAVKDSHDLPAMVAATPIGEPS